ncbi:MAG: bifunctional metallophosphatase/5'-nucleotidase [Candidatus Cryptobacteroides sp.]
MKSTLQNSAIALLISLFAISCTGPKDGTYVFRLLTTNDVHGQYFDSVYVGGTSRNSLTSVSWYVDSIRTAVGKENVIFVDAGDCLQGDNAAYYYNYEDVTSKHLYARMAEYMGYDAVVVGNHDIETGHPVYDKLAREMKVPFLAANAISTKTGKPYFRSHVLIERQGIRILIAGFTNPNIRNWLSPKLWEGIEFESLIPAVQDEVDRLRRKERPDVVIVAVHSGTGDGDGKILESQGLDLFKSLSGVDFLICSHDHRPVVHCSDSICLINSGSHARNIGNGTITLEVKDGKVVSRTLEADLIPVDKGRIDTRMRDMFRPEYEAVKAFTLREVGYLETDLRTRDAYRGMSDYMNLVHSVCLSCEPAQISFAAPLTFNGFVGHGTLLYNDLFTIYPYENQLFVVRMTGREIKDYLEYSYDGWINTVGAGQAHLLKIQDAPDPRTSQKRWSFVNRSYNFDSAAGIVYDVDVTKPFGERIGIVSLADGTPYDMDADYNVAMTSYRASGGGNLMREGAGIDPEGIEDRVVEYFPEIRNILYDYIQANGSLTEKLIGNPDVIGHWEFVPSALAQKMLDADMDLLFPPRR